MVARRARAPARVRAVCAPVSGSGARRPPLLDARDSRGWTALVGTTAAAACGEIRPPRRLLRTGLHGAAVPPVPAGTDDPRCLVRRASRVVRVARRSETAGVALGGGLW